MFGDKPVVIFGDFFGRLPLRVVTDVVLQHRDAGVGDNFSAKEQKHIKSRNFYRYA